MPAYTLTALMLTRRTQAQWRTQQQLKAVELARLETETAYRNAPQWRLPVPPRMPVDTFMHLSNDGWLLGDVE